MTDKKPKNIMPDGVEFDPAEEKLARAAYEAWCSEPGLAGMGDKEEDNEKWDDMNFWDKLRWFRASYAVLGKPF
jgi:hypothetical protein